MSKENYCLLQNISSGYSQFIEIQFYAQSANTVDFWPPFAQRAQSRVCALLTLSFNNCDLKHFNLLAQFDYKDMCTKALDLAYRLCNNKFKATKGFI